ncbi:MAG: DUF3990 domain-containing protein [Eubacterium sp.]|nr:DUF3990 domain-containing protein [Eubacterium sp.]
MLIYHGSTVIVEYPMIRHNQWTLDFGQGFYTTSNKEQAIRWVQKVKHRRDAEKCFCQFINLTGDLQKGT